MSSPRTASGPPAVMRTVRRRFTLSRRMLLSASLGLGAAAVSSIPLISGLRIDDPDQPLTDEWRTVPIAPRRSALLGVSFRPLQAEAFGLAVDDTLQTLLQYPIQLVRLGAYWNRIETQPGAFDTSSLDRQVDAVEHVGAKIVLCVGALKSFGFPEYFIPDYYMSKPVADGTTFTPEAYPGLLSAASDFIGMIVDRYRSRSSIIAWQLENEPLDPVPFAHNWRLSKSFLTRELEALRSVDPRRPVMVNGYSSASPAISLGQAWLTRDQGDSVAFAKEHADIVAIDYYPRVAVSAVGSRVAYVDATTLPWESSHHQKILDWGRSNNRRVMIAEGQAEPWELTTVPPSPLHQALYSCSPTDIINTYNGWLRASDADSLYAYLFWGAEYWVRRQQLGDPEYLNAFARVLETA